MKRVYILILTTLVFSGISNVAYAQRNKQSSQTTKVGIQQQTYSGAKNKSFSDGSPGYGVEISTDRGNTFFRYFLKGRVTHSEGVQSFLNGTTSYKSGYKFSSFAPELGINLYPVLKRERGLNMYVWAVGVFSYNFLEITTIPTNSSLSPKDQAYGYGYGGGIGFEIMLGSARSRSSAMLYGEVGFRDERSQLARQNDFEVSGMTYSLGFGF